MAVQTVDILGVSFSTMTMDETVKYLKEQLEAERTHTFQVVTANPEIVMCAKKDEKFYQTLLNTDLITPDGIGVVKASGMLGTPLKERVAGFDLMCNLLAKLSEDSKPVSVFLLGAKPHVVQAAADHLTKTYSAVSIVNFTRWLFQTRRRREYYFSHSRSKTRFITCCTRFPQTRELYPKQ